MLNIINLSVDTKAGEDLYVYPYSINYGQEQKLFYYCSPEFTVNNTNEFFKLDHINPIKANTILITNICSNWFNYFTDQFRWFFGNSCFDNNFKNYRWSLYIRYLLCLKDLSYILPATSVFGKDISLRGQLKVVTNSKYIDNYYLIPTTEYFNERLDEWLNEDVVSTYKNLTYTTEEDKQEIIEYEQNLRKQYKQWRDTEINKGNKIEYLYSLNT